MIGGFEGCFNCFVLRNLFVAADIPCCPAMAVISTNAQMSMKMNNMLGALGVNLCRFVDLLKLYRVVLFDVRNCKR